MQIVFVVCYVLVFKTELNILQTRRMFTFPSVRALHWVNIRYDVKPQSFEFFFNLNPLQQLVNAMHSTLMNHKKQFLVLSGCIFWQRFCLFFLNRSLISSSTTFYRYGNTWSEWLYLVSTHSVEKRQIYRARRRKIIFALTISLHTPSMLYEKADSTTGNCFANIRLYIAGLRNNGIDLSIWHNQDVLMYCRDDSKL